MELQIEGRHFKVSEAIQTHLEEKLGKLEKYFDGIHRMHVILAVEKSKRQTVELVCTVAKRHTLFAKGEAEDMYVAIDKAEKKMLTEMKKYKAKLRPVVRGNKRAELLGTVVAADMSEDDGLDEE
jgi:putative sigma-54 modulation protein